MVRKQSVLNAFENLRSFWYLQFVLLLCHTNGSILPHRAQLCNSQLRSALRSGKISFDMGFALSGAAVALPYIQITLSVLLIAAILLQQRGSSLGGAFGGDNFSSAFHKRRGAELFLFRATIVLGTLFVISVLLSLAV